MGEIVAIGTGMGDLVGLFVDFRITAEMQPRRGDMGFCKFMASHHLLNYSM
jgi:hypothetical protein